MKKLITAAIALTTFSAAGFAQAVPAKKADAPKMQVVKNTTTTKTDAKVVAFAKPAQVAVAKTPVVAKTSSAAAKPAAVAKTNTASATPLKKDGTPDKRFKANTTVAAGPLKKDGTPDKRFKANQKH